MTQEVLCFENVDHIDRFIAGASANSNVAAALEHLTIALQHAYPLRLLCKALELAPNLTDLILILPSPFPHRVLEGLTFVHLRLLKTNLPHRLIATFLSTNPSIRFLDLGPCGKSRTCPLRLANLSRIPDIRCPVECSTTIVHLGVVRVRAELSRPTTVVSSVLWSFPISFFAVYTLSLQFNPSDDDILASIAKFVPMVRVLRLWERADYEVRELLLFGVHNVHSPPFKPLDPGTPRPWQNATSLRNNLLKMRFLDHFVVRTTALFVPVPGLPQERRIIFTWVGENTPLLKHPHLRFVTVWYRATELGAGILTRWQKKDDVWEGESVDSPSEDELGICMY